MRRWYPLVVLAAAQFVMVLDTSVMNVSITQIVDDLDTSVEGVQLAITAYALVMAASMLVGARLGGLWGTSRAFIVGVVVYGTGSLTTALSPSLPVLLFGWSFVEGIGAALVLPAIAALAAATYTGRERAIAYGVLGGVAGSAIAIGPVVGGWVTTNFSWRYVFVAEVVALVLVVAFRRQLPAVAPLPGARMDVVGALQSAAGLALVVLGILQGGSWGWIRPTSPPVVGGHELAPLGFSPVPFVVATGLLVLWWMSNGLERRRELGQPVLVDLRLLRVPAFHAGLATLLMQQLVLLGTFFVLPVYLQVVLGFDAFETGVRLLPMSLALLVFALGGPALAARRSIRTTVNLGIVLLVAGTLALSGAVDAELAAWHFTTGLVLAGAGAGLLMSQLGNVIMSSAPPEQASDAGGLQFTAQNLGASLGTALIGSILLAGLTAGFASSVASDDRLDPQVRDRVVAATQGGVGIVPIDVARTIVDDAGITAPDAEAIVERYAEAELRALKGALLVAALLALATLWPARRLPRSLEPTSGAAAQIG